MKKLLFYYCFLLGSFLNAQETQDSLILEIGDKAKVIFLAKERKDFQEISKYDLNGLYQKLLETLQTGKDTTLEEINVKDISLYKNPIYPTSTSLKKKFLKGFNVNLFLGFSTGGITEHFFRSPALELQPPIGGTLEVYNTAEVTTIPKLSYGISINTEFPLISQNRKILELSSSFGIDILKFNQQSNQSGGGFSYIGTGNPDVIDGFQQMVDSLRNELPIGIFGNETAIDQLYLQFMPTFTLLDHEGKRVWSLGVGTRGGVDLKNIFLPKDPKEPLVFSNDKLVVSQNNTFQLGFVSNVGYRWVNIFLTYLPKVVNVQEFDGLVRADRTGRYLKGIWFIGLRFGK